MSNNTHFIVGTGGKVEMTGGSPALELFHNLGFLIKDNPNFQNIILFIMGILIVGGLYSLFFKRNRKRRR